MDIADINRLVDATLHGRAITSAQGSCLTVNSTGLALLRVEDDILNEVERAIDSVVLESNDSQLPLGLNYVIGAFMLNGATHCPKRVVEYFSRKSDIMIEQFLGNLAVFFKATEHGRLYGKGLPDEYVVFLNRFASATKDGRLKEVARRTKNRLKLE